MNIYEGWYKRYGGKKINFCVDFINEKKFFKFLDDLKAIKWDYSCKVKVNYIPKKERDIYDDLY